MHVCRSLQETHIPGGGNDEAVVEQKKQQFFFQYGDTLDFCEFQFK